MATQKQAIETLQNGGRIMNGLQLDSSGALRAGVKGRLTTKQVAAVAAKNPNAPIEDNRQS
jgi:hypothetical protein